MTTIVPKLGGNAMYWEYAMLGVMGKLMGIDYGTKRVGIALTDESGAFAFPREVVVTKHAPDRVGELIAEECIEQLVIGHSIDREGNDNPVMQDIRVFAETLSETHGIEVIFVEERYTSLEARRQFETKEKTRKPKNKDPIDDSAAALILQSYIDRTIA